MREIKCFTYELLKSYKQTFTPGDILAFFHTMSICSLFLVVKTRVFIRYIPKNLDFIVTVFSIISHRF